jgi:hypothetical protein
MKLALVFLALTCAAQQTPPGTPPAARKPAAPPPNTASPGAMDSLSNSLQDLNAIRDANLSRIQTAGCAPETAARLTDLRVKLRQSEAELSGESLSKSSTVVDPQIIAADWFKRKPDRSEPADARESRLLTEVLPGGAALRVAGVKPQQSAEQKKALEDEISRLRTEISRLSATCVTVKK